jgi:hypothetical protein
LISVRIGRVRIMVHKLLAVVAAVAIVGAACGSDSRSGGAYGSSGGGAQGGTVSITAPSSGAKVSEPFTLRFQSSDPIGPTSSGEHHVHVYYDGNDSKYEVVTATSYVVKDLTPGRHTITASLRNADHSYAGAEDEITVTVAAGSQTKKSGNKGGGGY